MKYTVRLKGAQLSRHKTAYSAVRQIASIQQPVCKHKCKSVRECINKLVSHVGGDRIVCQHCPYELDKRAYKGANPHGNA